MGHFEINDAMTWSGTIPAKGPWRALSFRFRPALPEVVADYMRGPAPGKKQFDAMIGLLTSHLLEWDACKEDAEGKKGIPIVLTEPILRSIGHHYLIAMQDHICGYGGEGWGPSLKNSPSA